MKPKTAKDTLGRLELIIGPMFSGKTSELIRRIKRYNFAGYRCLIIKYSNVTNCEDSVATHDGLVIKAISTNSLLSISDSCSSYDVIGVDKGHFFPDLEQFCNEKSDSGVKLIVAALDGTFQRQAFNVVNLIPNAEDVIKLNSICMSCSKDAPYSKRLGKETEVEIIGGADKYIAVCENCFHLSSPVKSNPFITWKPPLSVIAIDLF